MTEKNQQSGAGAALRKEVKIQFEVPEGETKIAFSERQLWAAISEIKRHKWPRFALAIPTERTVRDLAFLGFMSVAARGAELIKQPYTRCDIARNKFAFAMLNAGDTWTHLVMLDSDHVHPPDILQRFEEDLLQYPQMKVLGGLNFRRGAPYDPCAFGKDEHGRTCSMIDWEPGIMKVDYLGSGSICIAKEVFEQIEPPWFGYTYERAHLDQWPGTDIFFSDKCKEAGIDQYVDTRITSPHIGDLMVDESVYRAYLKQHPTIVVDAEPEESESPGAILSAQDMAVPGETEWLIERDRLLRKVASELFEPSEASVLYVGANLKRFHYGAEFAEANKKLTVLEIWPPYAKDLVNDWRVKHVVTGDVRRLDDIELPETQYDAAFWWHGPEHVYEQDVATAVAQLERRVKPGGLVVLGCPWGKFDEPGIDGNTAQAHKSALYPELFAGLGYTVATAGLKDTPVSSIIATKRIDT